MKPKVDRKKFTRGSFCGDASNSKEGGLVNITNKSKQLLDCGVEEEPRPAAKSAAGSEPMDINAGAIGADDGQKENCGGTKGLM